MLAFSIDYYGMIFRATQSVELFCAYDNTLLLRKYSVIFDMFSITECDITHNGDNIENNSFHNEYFPEMALTCFV